jgi:hypothetical protein
MLMPDITITILLSIVQSFIAILGIWVSIKPVRKVHHRRFIAVFVILLVVGIGLAVWQQMRSSNVQDALVNGVDEIRQNTKQQPKITVNVPPPSIQLLPSSNSATSPVERPLFLDCKLGPMPSVTKDGIINVLSLEPYSVESMKGGFQNYFTSSERFTWKSHRIIFHCSIINYMETSIFNVSLQFPIWFKEVIREGTNTEGSGEIIFKRKWQIDITKIDPGPDKAFKFYAWNGSDYFAGLDIPNQATFHFFGEKKSRVVPIRIGNRPANPLQPRPK